MAAGRFLDLQVIAGDGVKRAGSAFISSPYRPIGYLVSFSKAAEISAEMLSPGEKAVLLFGAWINPILVRLQIAL